MTTTAIHTFERLSQIAIDQIEFGSSIDAATHNFVINFIQNLTTTILEDHHVRYINNVYYCLMNRGLNAYANYLTQHFEDYGYTPTRANTPLGTSSKQTTISNC